MTPNTYLTAMTEVIDTSKDVITILKFVCIDTEDLTPHGNKAVRNLGSVFGFVFAASALGIVCIPPTVGLSLIIPAISAATATGLITAAMACGGDTSFVTREHGKKLKTLQKRHATSIEKLNGETEKIRQIVELLKKQGHSADSATVATLTCIARGLLDLGGGVKKIGAMVNTVHLFIKARQQPTAVTTSSSVVKNEGDTIISETAEAEAEVEAEAEDGGSVTSSTDDVVGDPQVITVKAAVADDGHISVLTTIEENLPKILPSEPQLAAPEGLKNGQPLTEIEVAFTPDDVGLLVGAWNKPEPLAEVLAEIIAKLEKDWEKRQEMMDTILALIDPQ